MKIKQIPGILFDPDNEQALQWSHLLSTEDAQTKAEKINQWLKLMELFEYHIDGSIETYAEYEKFIGE